MAVSWHLSGAWPKNKKKTLRFIVRVPMDVRGGSFTIIYPMLLLLLTVVGATAYEG